MNDRQILTDLYDVISSQQRLLLFSFRSYQALVNTLINESALRGFDDRFQDNHDHISKHPKGELFEALSVMQHKLDVIGETLKRDMGGLSN
jgi:hypothetical protein